MIRPGKLHWPPAPWLPQVVINPCCAAACMAIASVDSRSWACVCMGAETADVGGCVVHVCVCMEALTV